MLYALCILLGIVFARLFWRQLLTAAATCMVLLLCALLLRAAPTIGLPRDWLMTAYGAGIIGFFVGGAVALRPIINWLVNADRARGHERVDADADKRLV